MIIKNMWQTLTVLGAAVIFIFSILLGYRSGVGHAQSRTVLKNLDQLEKALAYFYNDQNRFPTAPEFEEQGGKNVLLAYATGFPSAQFVSGGCSTSFVYRQLSSQKYELNFCLPKSELNFAQGWNKKIVEK